MASIQGIYVALFGRPADPLGLQYFNGVTNNGANLSAIGSLSSTPEYMTRFAGQNNVQVVNSIYQTLFNRPADAAGLAFFVAELGAGRQNINTIAINILDGAQGADKTVVDTKIAAANLFTSRVDTGPEIVAYSGDAAAAQGRAFIAPVTTTVPNTAQADAAVAAVVTANAGGGSGAVGSTLTLAITADTLVGTAGADTFRAVTANSLQTVDNINGGAGTDVLNISAGAIGLVDPDGAGALPAAAVTVSPVLVSVERINNNDGTASTLDLSAATGVLQVWSGANGQYTGADIATVFGTDATGAASTVTIDYSAALTGTNDVANLAVNNNANLTTFTSVDQANIEGLNISSQGTGAADLINVSNFAAVKTITITGGGDISVATGAVSTITKVDASAATGNVTVNLANSTNAVEALGGSGNDNFTTGAANDILKGGAGADTYTTNGGSDTVFVQTTTIGVNGNDTVTDFSVANDKLEFGGAAGFDGAGTNFGFTTSANDFISARSAAETFLQTAANASVDYVQVDVGNDSYVFYDGNGDNSLSTNGVDHAVLLTGVGVQAVASIII